MRFASVGLLFIVAAKKEAGINLQTAKGIYS
jgi:hypothetical protein